MMLGKFKLNTILWVASPLMVFTPCYCYYMAVKNKEEPPFPHATITNTACHYPQDIEFRFIMLMCSTILALSFYVVFRWVENQARRVDFPPPERYLFYIVEGSMLCYGITMGTIDGAGTGNLHSPCAVIFFIIWFIVIVNMTVYLTKLRKWDTSTISRISLSFKQLFAGYISLVWLWCLYNLITEGFHGNKQDIYVVILQWNSVFMNMFWLLSFVAEWKFFNVCLVRRETLLLEN